MDFCPVDLFFFPIEFPGTGEHELDLAKNIDISLDHLAANPSFDIALNNDRATLGMGGHMDERILLDNDGAAKHERPDIITGDSRGS